MMCVYRITCVDETNGGTIIMENANKNKKIPQNIIIVIVNERVCLTLMGMMQSCYKNLTYRRESQIVLYILCECV